MSSTDTWKSQQRRLPAEFSNEHHPPLIIGYAHDCKSGKSEQAIKDGARVIIWSFLHLDTTASKVDERYQIGSIRSDLDVSAIRKLRDKYQHVLHLAAFGGWNGPHPPIVKTGTIDSFSSLTGKEWCDVFMEYNKSLGYLFDGIDWDYEGHDDLNSPTAKFTLATLDIMADFSVQAKQKYGMIVSMAPAESYLDASADPDSIDVSFSLDLDLPPRAFTSSQHATNENRELIKSVNFSHAGRQCYAYVIAKAGIDTFDWISIQLYEAYSPFLHDVSTRRLDPVGALMIRVNGLVNGYKVTGLPLPSDEYNVKIPPSRLVIGIANGWADGMKFCKVTSSSLKAAYETTSLKHGENYLGVMFWVSTILQYCTL